MRVLKQTIPKQLNSESEFILRQMSGAVMELGTVATDVGTRVKIRYNTSTAKLEVFASGSWLEV